MLSPHSRLKTSTIHFSCSVLATGPKILGFKPDRGRCVFKGDKNPYHDFIRRGNKAVFPTSLRFYGILKNITSMNYVIRTQYSAVISSPIFPASLLDVTA
jgi:hypothetical protein